MRGRERAASETVQVHVNGAVCDVRAGTLGALLLELGYGERRIATAVNGEFVPERARVETRLAPGDHIEIVAPRQGG